jgi:predicted TIM-barrel fold metal-dependent hydrolase
VACKFWKNIGMAIKKPDETFLMIDDPLFDPIYEYLERSGRTALMHIADPLASWQPPDEQNPHFNYYSQHSEWHMYLKPDYPSHEQLMDARDRVLERFPKLRVVGAHLASLEHDVAEVTRRLERYPNLAVDTSARTLDLALQDKDSVRTFFSKYQDRILFGTDVVETKPLSSATEEKRSEAVEGLMSRIKLILSFFGSEDDLEFRGRQIRGLGLPYQVVEKVTRLNAVNYYGIENR